MKCDLTKKQSIATKRTLKSLLSTLGEMMESQPIEKISVMDLCAQAMIPRATFYNYFEDKYDLLQYFWRQLETEMTPDFKESESETYLDMNALTNNMIKNFAKNMSKWKKISNANIHDILVPNLFNHLRRQAMNQLNTIPKASISTPLPPDLLSTYYACVVIGLGEWWVENKESYTPEEIQEFFKELIDWEKLMN